MAFFGGQTKTAPAVEPQTDHDQRESADIPELHEPRSTTGMVKGPVEADVIRIAGQVEGNLVSHDHVQLERTGTINGDVTTVSFVIENGGRLNGRTTMLPEQASKPHVDGLKPSKPVEKKAEEPED